MTTARKETMTTPLATRNAYANLAVRDLKKAREFYEGKLGLKQVDSQEGELIVFKSGDTTINVYRSEFAGSNKATAVTWMVGDDIEDVARTLKDKGISFEQYEMPQLKRQGDIYVGPKDQMKVAWFKDPDGNVLNIVSGGK